MGVPHVPRIIVCAAVVYPQKICLKIMQLNNMCDRVQLSSIARQLALVCLFGQN